MKISLFRDKNKKTASNPLTRFHIPVLSIIDHHRSSQHFIGLLAYVKGDS
jgi:hypothetical protein